MPLKSLLPLIEIGFATYFSYFLYYAFAHGQYLTLPFLILFQVGFLYVALCSLAQWLPRFIFPATRQIAFPA
jgi:hypothetical protein